jgi:hypothetical protein
MWLTLIRTHEVGFEALDALVIDAAAELRRLGVPPRSHRIQGWWLNDASLVIGEDGLTYLTGHDLAGDFLRRVGADIHVPPFDLDQPGYPVRPGLKPRFPQYVGQCSEDSKSMGVNGDGQLVWDYTQVPYVHVVACAIVDLARTEGVAV